MNVVFSRNALDYIARLKIPDACAHAFFSKYKPLEGRPFPFWHVRPMREYARTQALLLSRDKLLDQRIVQYRKRLGIETVFGRLWPNDKCYIHYPNPVEHIGNHSSYREQGLQISGCFAGRDFDTLRWIDAKSKKDRQEPKSK